MFGNGLFDAVIGFSTVVFIFACRDNDFIFSKQRFELLVFAHELF